MTPKSKGTPLIEGGLDAPELLERCFHDLQVPREEAPTVSVLRTGVPVRDAEAKIERSDSSCIWTRVNIEPLQDDAGHVVGATAASNRRPRLW